MTAHPRLGAQARAAIGNPANSVAVSVACVWEIAIKSGLGRLDLEFPRPVEDMMAQAWREHGFVPLAIDVEHAVAVRHLPQHHGDPFDRLIIAQARLLGLTLLTADRVFSLYDVPVMPALR
jgi:PIN domain nuclease of toxin-antitoxin system